MYEVADDSQYWLESDIVPAPVEVRCAALAPSAGVGEFPKMTVAPIGGAHPAVPSSKPPFVRA